MSMRWYVVQAYSQYENNVMKALRERIGRAGLEAHFGDILVPTEEVIEVRRGKKVTTERRFMPGYVLVHMEMSDQGYHLINSINRVTGFLGPQGRPMPMRSRLKPFPPRCFTRSRSPLWPPCPPPVWVNARRAPSGARPSLSPLPLRRPPG